MSKGKDIDLACFREILLQRQQDLLSVAQTGLDAAEIVELDQTRVGRLSRMDQMQAQAMSRETNRRRKIELERIIAALERIESGDYGFCISCGDEILVQRLEIDPSNPFCLTCASQVEKT
jgi:DnaK suppressor protein